MTDAIVMGVDPSLTGFAIALGRGGELVAEKRIATKPCASDVRSRLKRYALIADPLTALCETHRPAIVCIEGYSFASKGAGLHHRSELLGVVFERIAPYVGQILEIPPSTLKQFTTGKGNAQKPEMVSVLAQRHGRTFFDDDTADAFALLQLAFAVAGQVDPGNAQRCGIVAKLRGVELAA